MKKHVALVGSIALSLTASSCRTTQSDANLLQDDQKEINVVPKSILEKADKVVQDDAKRQFLKMLVDLAILREQLPQDVQVNDEIKGYWTNSVYASLKYTASATVGTATAVSLHKSAENIQSYANIANAIAGVAAQVGNFSSTQSEKFAEFLFNQPAIKKSVEASLDSAEFSGKQIQALYAWAFGSKAAKYAFGGSIGISVLGSIPSSQSFQGESGIKKSEWIQSITGYRTQIAESTNSYVDTLAVSLDWTKDQRDRFQEAFVQEIINIAISNDFDAQKEYSVDPFTVMDQLNMSNERSQSAQKLFKTFDAYTSNMKVSNDKELKTSTSVEFMAAAAAQLQATLNSGKFSTAERARINALLNNTLSTIKKWEMLYDPTKGL